MSDFHNELGQPIGFPLADWQAACHPRDSTMQGRLCRLERLDPGVHAAELWRAFGQDIEQRNWTYLPYGPFGSETALADWISSNAMDDDPCFFAVIDARSGKAVGVASYLRIEPAVGVIEVGHIHFSPLMQGRPISTEAMYLMMKQAFDGLGYRRYEWKCDALNAPSCRSALRLGFQFEGIFRQATIYKQRNRDTAWYSILDREWPTAKSVYESWLAPANFSADGAQLSRLSERMRATLANPR